MYKKYIKRLLDIIASSIVIVLLFVPMLIVAVIIKIDSPGPVLFKQKRVGLHKKEFVLLKFRSMPIDAPNEVATPQFDVSQVKMTAFQKFIRKYSIDELPQFLNIVSGKCSLVGPRPVIAVERELVEERDKRGVYDTKPGLTGLAQINGRDMLSFEIKAKIDAEYCKILNTGGFKALLMDLKCLFGTVKVVIRHEGVVEGIGIESEAENEAVLTD